MEAHWQVDCHQLWRQLVDAVSSADNCGLSAPLQRDLQLCSYIYQPPGESNDSHCPDYGRARALLNAENTAGRCNNLKALVDDQADCAVLGYGQNDK